jgi:hypothetical protein
MLDITFPAITEASDAEDLLRRAAFESVSSAVRPILEPLRCPEHGEGLTRIAFEPSEDGLQATLDGCCEDFMEQARDTLFAGLGVDGKE